MVEYHISPVLVVDSQMMGYFFDDQIQKNNLIVRREDESVLLSVEDVVEARIQDWCVPSSLLCQCSLALLQDHFTKKLASQILSV